ncbi:MAG: hypothetical protein KAT71_02905 [Gammaproteobacteria bacterium]|nr:hypothetical protein [Gammaproteobacteria bacterium]
MRISYSETEKFKRDFKKLLKKFLSLKNDLEVVKRNAIEIFHIYNIDNNSVCKIQDAGNFAELFFYKIKKFACRNLKGHGAKSGIRVVYAFFPKKQQVIFLEMYFKANQENETRQRIIDYKIAELL